MQIVLEKHIGGIQIILTSSQVKGMDIDEVKHELINRIYEYFSEIN